MRSRWRHASRPGERRTNRRRSLVAGSGDDPCVGRLAAYGNAGAAAMTHAERGIHGAQRLKGEDRGGLCEEFKYYVPGTLLPKEVTIR